MRGKYLFKGKPLTIAQFGDAHGLKLIAEERNSTEVKSGLPRFIIYFEHVEVIGGGMLTSEYGSGKTLRQALTDYENAILGKDLRCPSSTLSESRRVTAPLEWAKLRIRKGR